MSTLFRILCLLATVLACACFHFHNETLEAYHDPVSGGTVVLLDFEFDRRKQPQLDRTGFTIIEDGVELSTAERERMVERRQRPSVLILLDVTSLSDDAGAESIRSVIQPVIDELTSDRRTPVEIWLFSSRARRVINLADVGHEVPAGDPEHRMTALYGALNRALLRTEHRVVIAITDGADNKQDEPGRDAYKVARACHKAHYQDHRSVHVFGFGQDLGADHDRDNTEGERALKIIARGCGTKYQHSRDFEGVRDAIDGALSAPYGFRYISAHSSGRHVIRIGNERRVAYSRRMGFRAEREYSCSTHEECVAVGQRLWQAGAEEAARLYFDHLVTIEKIP